jgi:hypothetical protein
VRKSETGGLITEAASFAPVTARIVLASSPLALFLRRSRLQNASDKRDPEGLIAGPALWLLPESRLVDCSRGLQVYRLPFALYDALTNLRRSLALPGHGVRVVKLFQTNRTLGAVSALEATVQTVVTHPTITVAIAGLLVQHSWNLGGQFVGVALERVLRVLSP